MLYKYGKLTRISWRGFLYFSLAGFLYLGVLLIRELFYSHLLDMRLL